MCGRDWSSDVCSSDLERRKSDYAGRVDEESDNSNESGTSDETHSEESLKSRKPRKTKLPQPEAPPKAFVKELYDALESEIGRASCRERV